MATRCEFLVPIVRDSDRKPHDPATWTDLENELLNVAGGFSVDTTLVEGAWRAPDGRVVRDLSRRFVVAVDPFAPPVEGRPLLFALRGLLAQYARAFDQTAIYLSIGDRVEFVTPNAEN